MPPDESEIIALLRDIRDLQREQLASIQRESAETSRREAERDRKIEEATSAANARRRQVAVGTSAVASVYALLCALVVIAVVYVLFVKLGH